MCPLPATLAALSRWRCFPHNKLSLPRPLHAAWFARQEAAGQAPTSPLTGLTLANRTLQPNRMVRSLADALAAAGLLQ